MADPVLFISDDVVRSVLDMGGVLGVIEDDFRRQAAADAIVYGQPLAWSTDDRQLGFRWRLKTAVLRGVPVAGVRIAGYKIDSTGAGGGGEREATRYIVLSDPGSGSPLAIVDEHSSFGMRTAGSVLVAAKHLARRDARTIGVIGAGNVARSIVLGLPHIFDVAEVRVTSRRADVRDAFCAEMAAATGLKITSTASYEAVCRDADVIFSATPSAAPFVKFDWLKPGVFLGVVGHDELEHDVFARCDRFYVDYDFRNEQHPHHIKAAIASGVLGADRISGALWEVVAGRQPGRRKSEERVVVATVGLTSQDIALAYDVYQRAKADGRGITLPF